jgi:hypothetical protein
MSMCSTSVRIVGPLFAGLVALAGCQSKPQVADNAVNPSLSRLSVPEGATPIDADRAALSRFVGVWRFEGVTVNAKNEQTTVQGNAAGTIEKEHFVLLELAPTSGQMGGRAVRSAGSMLFAAEPGVGLTVTAWGDASPAINRMTGATSLKGGVFSFAELRTPTNAARMGMTITFETDDRFVAAISDLSKAGRPVLARYTFSRSK